MVTTRHPDRRRRSGWISALGFSALLAGGCTTFEQYVHNGFKVGPEYGRPAAAVAPDWIDAGDQRVRKESDDLSQWWTVFNDATLDGLICDAYRQNLSLRQAGFQVLLARAQLGTAIGGFFPQSQTMSGDYLREGLSVATVNRTAAGTAKRFFGQWDYGFNLAWELDFWGRFRRTIESADGNLDASVENYDDVLVTLLGDVATNYVTIRTLQERLKLTQANVDLQRRTLEIAEARFRGGTGTELDVDQAQSNLSQTESEIPQLEVQLRIASNQLCILLGIPPENLEQRLGTSGIPAAPPDVAAGIPADLIRRRPDVRRAERLAAAQSALIGVAESDFYPHISIDGSFGYSAEHLNRLFTSKAFNGTFGPGFNWKILNYGRILNNVRAQDAQFQSLVTAYQNSVLLAGAEVENGLVSFLKAHVRVKALSESVRAAQKAANIALVQYRNGVVDFNRVALLQQNLVQQQDLLAQATGDIALGLIQVYKALGGGWQIRCNGCSSEMPAVTIPAANSPPTSPAPEAKPPQLTK